MDAYLRGLPSKATRAEYERAIGLLDTFLGERELLDASRRDIEAWRAAMEAAGLAPSTISKRMSAVTGLFAFALDEGLVSINPAARARRPRVPSESPRRGLSPAEVRAMLDACDDSLLGLRDRMVITVLAVQGWRVGELLALAVEALDEEGGHRVATIHGKGRKVVRVPLAAASCAAISMWLDAAGVGAGPVVLAVRKGEAVGGKAISPQAVDARLKRLARRAGLTRRVHAHLLRHGAATAALDAGVPLRSVQDFLRHADPRTTRRYDSHRQSLNNPTPHVLADKVLAA